MKNQLKHLRKKLFIMQSIMIVSICLGIYTNHLTTVYLEDTLMSFNFMVATWICIIFALVSIFIFIRTAYLIKKKRWK